MILHLRKNKFIHKDCIESAFSWLRQYSLRQAGPLMARKWCKRSAFLTNNFVKENNFWQTYVLTLHQGSSHLAHGKDDVVEVSSSEVMAPPPPSPTPSSSAEQAKSVLHNSPYDHQVSQTFPIKFKFCSCCIIDLCKQCLSSSLVEILMGNQLHNTLSQSSRSSYQKCDCKCTSF